MHENGTLPLPLPGGDRKHPCNGPNVAPGHIQTCGVGWGAASTCMHPWLAQRGLKTMAKVGVRHGSPASGWRWPPLTCPACTMPRPLPLPPPSRYYQGGSFHLAPPAGIPSSENQFPLPAPGEIRPRPGRGWGGGEGRGEEKAKQ